MFEQIMAKAANAATIALFGQEVGSHVVKNAQQQNTTETNHNEIIIGLFILLVIMAKATSGMTVEFFREPSKHRGQIWIKEALRYIFTELNLEKATQK